MSDKENENEFQVQELINSYNKILSASFYEGQENPDFDKNFEILTKQIKKLCENKVDLKIQYLGEQKCQLCTQPFTYEEIQDYDYAEGQCGHKFHQKEFRQYVLKCSELLNEQELKQKLICPVKDCNQSLYETEPGGIIDQVYNQKHFEDLRELKNPLQCIVCPNWHLQRECKQYFCDYCKNKTFYTIECRDLQINIAKEQKNANIQFKCNKCDNKQNIVKLIQKNEDILVQQIKAQNYNQDQDNQNYQYELQMRGQKSYQIQCSHCNENPKKDMKENYQQGKNYVINNFLNNKNEFNSEIIFHENQIQKCLLHSEIEQEKHIYLHIDRTQQIAICFKCQIVYCAVCQNSYEQKDKQLFINCDCKKKYLNKLPCLICNKIDVYNTEFQVNMRKYQILVPIGICQQHNILEEKLKEEIQIYLEKKEFA